MVYYRTWLRVNEKNSVESKRQIYCVLRLVSKCYTSKIASRAATKILSFKYNKKVGYFQDKVGISFGSIFVSPS